MGRWAPAGVRPLVLKQRGPLAKAAPALPTLIGPAVSVRSQELLHVLMAPLGHVDLPVPLQVRADTEALPTLPTLIGPLSGVHASVPLQIGALDEAFAAITASKRPLSGVDTPVLGEVGTTAEALPAIPAAMRPFASVRLTVFGERRALAEAFAALRAPMRRRRTDVIHRHRAMSRSGSHHGSGVRPAVPIQV